MAKALSVRQSWQLRAFRSSSTRGGKSPTVPAFHSLVELHTLSYTRCIGRNISAPCWRGDAKAAGGEAGGASVTAWSRQRIDSRLSSSTLGQSASTMSRLLLVVLLFVGLATAQDGPSEAAVKVPRARIERNGPPGAD